MASRSIDLISKKRNCTCSTLFFLISNKTNLHVQHAFVFLCRCFAQLQRCFLNFLVTHYFYGGIVEYFVSCVHVRFYLSLPLIFTLLAAGISHCLTAALNFHAFLPQNSSLLFSITRSSSFSVIHVSVNIKKKKKTSKKTRLCCCFFSLKVQAVMRFLSK